VTGGVPGRAKGDGEAPDTDVADDPTAGAMPAVRLVAFTVAGRDYGVPVERVQEVVRVGTITRVPASPRHARGVTNHRGRIIPVIDVATAVGAAAAGATGRDARLLAVEVGDRVVGLLVERTLAVVSVAADEPSWRGRPLHVLDVERVVEGR
jgi:chemotaxis signal transduction protein